MGWVGIIKQERGKHLKRIGDSKTTGTGTHDNVSEQYRDQANQSPGSHVGNKGRSDRQTRGFECHLIHL